jgi:phage terminase Nu1 subunit (DNA packaging protein)
VNEIIALLQKVQPELDKIRAEADKVNAEVTAFESGVTGRTVIGIAEKIPEAGAILSALMTLQQVVVSALDSIDGVVDSYAAPAATAAATPLPQAGQ